MGTSGCSNIHLLSIISDPRTKSLTRVLRHIQQIPYIFLKEELEKIAEEEVDEANPEKHGLFTDYEEATDNDKSNEGDDKAQGDGSLDLGGNETAKSAAGTDGGQKKRLMDRAFVDTHDEEEEVRTRRFRDDDGVSICPENFLYRQEGSGCQARCQARMKRKCGLICRSSSFYFDLVYAHFLLSVACFG